MQETAKIWMNGELVDWADATVHVGVHGLHYGTGVFEGIRAYETPKGPAVFRLADHMQRLHDSARLLYMDLPYSVEELRTATHDLVRANGLPAAYIRPIAFFGYGSLGVHTRGNPVETVIMSWPWGAYLGEDSLTKGITAKISSWTRVGPNVIPHVSKATGIYLNSMLATTEAQRAGYDEGILLTDNGFVADGPGENIFVVKDGRILTPPLSTSILPGITRGSVIEIARDLGYVVEETDVIRTDLYLADEVFMTGTAAEVTPVRAVDDVELGVGDVTLELQRTYLDVVNGRTEQWSHWLDVVETSRDSGVAATVLASRSAAGESSVATTRSCSSSVSDEPLGRQSPRSKRRAPTSPPNVRCDAKIGCRCIGFQSGRASMSSASSARRTVSRSAPNASGSTTMHVSHAFDVPYAASGMNVTPGTPSRSSRYRSRIRRRAATRIGSVSSCARPSAARRLLSR